MMQRHLRRSSEALRLIDFFFFFHPPFFLFGTSVCVSAAAAAAARAEPGGVSLTARCFSQMLQDFFFLIHVKLAVVVFDLRLQDEGREDD